VYAGETKIRRHVKIRQDANSFDPQWNAYFTDRAFQKKFGIHRHQVGIKTVVKPAPEVLGQHCPGAACAQEPNHATEEMPQ